MAGNRARRPASIPAWVKILQNHLGAYKHAEFGLGTSTMQAQRYGYTQMVNNAILTNSSYKLRFAQDITLYLSEIGLDLPGFDIAAGKKHWLEDPIWQGVRKSIESMMGSNDYLEQYFATNVVFEPLVGELFRSGFLMQAASAQNDFITPAVVSAAEADYERNLANTVELFHILGTDPTSGRRTLRCSTSGLANHADLALDAANHLQPDLVAAAGQGRELSPMPWRTRRIVSGVSPTELGLTVPAGLAS